LRYLYRLIDLDQLQLDSNALPDLLQAAERMNFTGLNITFPCKQAIIRCSTNCRRKPGASAR
jgi:shikimate dehydrogenase